MRHLFYQWRLAGIFEIVQINQIKFTYHFFVLVFDLLYLLLMRVKILNSNQKKALLKFWTVNKTMLVCLYVTHR